MRLSKRVENLGEWGSVKVLSRSESRRAWEGMRAATVPWIVFKLLLLLPVGVFSVLGTDPTTVEAFAVAGLFAGLSLISAGVFSMQRQVPFENVRRLPGLALTVRDWPESVSGKLPEAPVYLTDTKLITLDRAGVIQETSERPDVCFGVTAGRSWVRLISIDGRSWSAYEVPL